MPNFKELGLRQELLRPLTAQGLIEPTPVQEKAIPLVLAGQDVVAQAQTGTGKTLAFVLPMLQRIDPTRPVVQGLIVTPTRELALQITSEIRKMTALLDDVHVLPVYGGQDVEAQLRKLQGAIHLVIATPGRLLDHLRRGTIDLSDVSMLVLDEADQMLHMGFLPDVEEVIRQVSAERQTMLFSATMPKPIRTLAKKYLTRPTDVRIKSERVTLDEVRQMVVEVTDRAKQETLQELIEKHRPFLAIIFCRTKRRATALNAALQEMGYDSDELHGDLTQAKREKVMKKFRDAKIQFLVATDVAARGLDVEGVTHVFNYDMPQDVESYIHRIGRTGRAGETGLAITLMAPKDRRELGLIEEGIGMQIERVITPSMQKRYEQQDEQGREGGSGRQGRDGGRGGAGRDGQGGGRDRGGRTGGGRSDRGDRGATSRNGNNKGDRDGRPSQGRPARGQDARHEPFSDKRGGSQAGGRSQGRGGNTGGGRGGNTGGGRGGNAEGGRGGNTGGGRGGNAVGGRGGNTGGGRGGNTGGGRGGNTGGGRGGKTGGGRGGNTGGGQRAGSRGRGR